MAVADDLTKPARMEGLILAHGLRGQPIMMNKAWQPEKLKAEVTGV